MAGLLAGLAFGGCSDGSVPVSGAGGDGGTGGLGGPDGGLPIDGRASFVVTGGAVFTLVLDYGARTAFIGSSTGNAIVPFTVAGPNRVSIAQSFSFQECHSRTTYNQVDLTIGAGTLTGRVMGWSQDMTTDVSPGRAISTTLTGVADREPPSFSLWTDLPAANPFASIRLGASEPLPGAAEPVLVDGTGNRTPLVAAGSQLAVFEFVLPAALRRYDERYRIVVEGTADFAGNVAGAGQDLSFITDAAPPIAAEDGFESIRGATFGGAQVMRGTGELVISGMQSLLVPDWSSSGAPETPFAFRLPVAPGDAVVRFSYRSGAPSPGLHPPIRFGIPGGEVVTFEPPFESSLTPVPMPGGGTVGLGPLRTAEVALPPGASGEIVVTRTIPYQGCSSFPPLPIGALLIDDLRVE